jgi:hypothetical protein
MVDVTNRANVHMRLGALEFTLSHRIFSLAAGTSVWVRMRAISDKGQKTQESFARTLPVCDETAAIK